MDIQEIGQTLSFWPSVLLACCTLGLFIVTCFHVDVLGALVVCVLLVLTLFLGGALCLWAMTRDAEPVALVESSEHVTLAQRQTYTHEVSERHRDTSVESALRAIEYRLNVLTERDDLKRLERLVTQGFQAFESNSVEGRKEQSKHDRKVKRLLDEVDTVLSQRKGDRFEEHIITRVLDGCTALIEWRSDHSFVREGVRVFPRSNMWPDLVFERAEHGHRTKFAIECKWRAQWGRAHQIEVCKPEKLKDYSKYSNQPEGVVPVFMALGVGGSPDAPEELYLLPLHEEWISQGVLSHAWSYDMIRSIHEIYPDEVCIPAPNDVLRFERGDSLEECRIRAYRPA